MKRKRTPNLPPFEKIGQNAEILYFCIKLCKAYLDKDAFTPGNIKSKNRCCKACWKALYSNICKHPGCKTRASYGVPDGKPTRCKVHKEDDMVDVRSKRCGVDGCTKQPSYGVPGGTATRCSGHKEDDMVNLVNVKCTYCKVLQASFGYADDKKKIACGGCRQPGMVDLTRKKCLTESCEEYTYQSFKDCKYCYQCHCRRNGKTPKYTKIKEMHFDEIIREICPDIIYNQKFPGTNYYPDWHIFFERFLFMIELDEFQHKSYDKQSEQDRIREIFEKSNRKHLVLLRINPDSYTDKTGKKVKGCYKKAYDENGLKCLVKRQKEFDRRKKIVQKTIRNIVDNADTIELEEEIITKKLFFDNDI